MAKAKAKTPTPTEITLGMFYTMHMEIAKTNPNVTFGDLYAYLDMNIPTDDIKGTRTCEFSKELTNLAHALYPNDFCSYDEYNAKPASVGGVTLDESEEFEELNTYDIIDARTGEVVYVAHGLSIKEAKADFKKNSWNDCESLSPYVVYDHKAVEYYCLIGLRPVEFTNERFFGWKLK